MDWRVLCGATLVLAAVYLGTSSETRALPIAAGSGLSQASEAERHALQELESKVSHAPDDADALIALVSQYLDHRAPGLAEAALARAPRTLQDRAQVADLRAQALSRLGNAPAALALQRSAIRACEREGCSAILVARAMRREAWLSEMVSLGVDDAAREPERALLAYRKSTREVRLEVD